MLLACPYQPTYAKEPVHQQEHCAEPACCPYLSMRPVALREPCHTRSEREPARVVGYRNSADAIGSDYVMHIRSARAPLPEATCQPPRIIRQIGGSRKTSCYHSHQTGASVSNSCLC